MDQLQCSIYQTDIAWKSPCENRKHYEQFFRRMESGNLIVLPEMCMSGFDTESTDTAEEAEGESYRFFREWAVNKKMAIAAGLAIKENGQVFNRLLWTDPDGRQTPYDKQHLFRMGKELLLYTAGQSSRIVSYQGWKLMLKTCYDLRFPISCRNSYRKEEGFSYDILIVAANWPASRKEAFQTLAKARAIENQCYVILANRIGRDGMGLDYSGNSMIIDFKGNVLASLPENEEGLISATLSKHALDEFRQKFPNYMDWDS